MEITKINGYDGDKCPNCGGQPKTIPGLDVNSQFIVGDVVYCPNCPIFLSVEWMRPESLKTAQPTVL